MGLRVLARVGGIKPIKNTKQGIYDSLRSNWKHIHTNRHLQDISLLTRLP